MFFRSSALTFNGHRIHDDLAWARAAEGYPGLAGHDPLQATLLAQFAERLKGERPRHFALRSLSTLFHDGQCSPEGVGLRLWTCRPGGPVAASASWD